MTSNFDNNKATEINRIYLKVLKFSMEPIAEHLYSIYNISFTTVNFPDTLNIAKVTPVYKKGSKLLMFKL